MKLEHVALSTEHLEEMRIFYETYFDAVSSDKYKNDKTEFESYFLEFSDGARLEIMKQPKIYSQAIQGRHLGYCHIAMSVGSVSGVENLTIRMENEGIEIVSYPRFTGDGYYESVVHDPDGNRIEITI